MEERPKTWIEYHHDEVDTDEKALLYLRDRTSPEPLKRFKELTKDLPRIVVTEYE